jgi:hypothetical protein
MYGHFPAKNTVYTPFIVYTYKCMVLANSSDDASRQTDAILHPRGHGTREDMNVDVNVEHKRA